MTMALIIFSIILVLSCYAQQVSLDDTEGYYWREYKRGVVPKDALPGGTNVNGNPTYIGQVLHQTLLIPARIDPEQDIVSYEWGHAEHITYKNVKIFCTKHPEQFEWLDTGDGLFGKINPDILVVGGFELGTTGIYIGRKQIDNELVQGKVLDGATGHTTLNVSYNGTGGPIFDGYQVLTYKPNNAVNQLQSLETDTRMKECSCNQHATNIILYS